MPHSNEHRNDGKCTSQARDEIFVFTAATADNNVQVRLRMNSLFLFGQFRCWIVKDETSKMCTQFDTISMWIKANE